MDEVLDERITGLRREIKELRRLLNERYQTQTRAVEAALAAQQTAMQTAFTASNAALEQRAATLDREFHEHLEQVRHENALAFANSDKAIDRAFAASDKAIGKADDANEKRFDSVNEFRSTLSDQAGQFVTRTESEAAIQRNTERIDELRDRMNRSEGKGLGLNAGWGYLVGAVGLLSAVMAVVLVLLSR